MAELNGTQISWIARWGRNGRKYVWNNPTQEQLNQLIKKYGCDQVVDDKNGNGVWLES